MSFLLFYYIYYKLGVTEQLDIPEAGEFLRPLLLGAPDTVRCTPDMSGEL
jgi:hypothetical protein